MEATGGKASSDDKTEGDARETSKVAGGGAGGKDLDSGAVSNWDLGQTVLTKMIQDEGKRIAKENNMMISQGHLPGALTL